MVEKDDIWETKNRFRNMISKTIKEYNMDCRTLEELEFLVLRRVKQHVMQEKPSPGSVDGPW